jgi:hypothetical protein
MSRAIDSAMAHFKDVLGQGLKGPIHVPEWKLDIWYKPATTFNQEARIVELTSQGKTVEALVEALIIRSLDVDGKPLFNKIDKPELMRAVDPSVIMRIMTEINNPESDTKIEEALGN